MGLEQLQFFEIADGSELDVHVLFIARNYFEALCKRRFDIVKLVDHLRYMQYPCKDCDDILNFRRSHR